MTQTANLLPGVKKNILLKDYTTFKIGGRARYFFPAKNKEELIAAVKASKKSKVKFFILGAGSNLLVSDKGFNGLIIKIENREARAVGSEITAGAGLELNKLVGLSLRGGLGGLEWASGIPGTVGGSLRGNAGAFGLSMADVVSSVESLDVEDFKFKLFGPKDCQFGYRQSVFKKNKNLIIFSATFKLKKEDKGRIGKEIEKYLDYRKEHHPKDPSAGSVFKNLEFRNLNPLLIKRFPELLQFKERGSIPVAFLIAECGLAGKMIGYAKISEKHANFILNTGKGKAKDVLALIKLAKKEVKKKFGLLLEEEIKVI